MKLFQQLLGFRSFFQQKCVLFYCLFLFFITGASTLFLHAESVVGPSPLYTSVTMSVEPISDEQNGLFSAVIELSLKDGWHTYWKNPGDIGSATTFTWELPKGIEFKDIQWPIPEQFDTSIPDDKGGVTRGSTDLYSFGYSHVIRWIAYFQGAVPKENSVITAHISWLACSDSSCVPQETVVSGELLHDTSDSAKKTYKASLDAALRAIPVEKKGCEILFDVASDTITCLFPVDTSRNAVSKTIKVDKAFLFLENEGIQTTAQAEMLLDQSGNEYGMRLQIPKERVHLLVENTTGPITFSGVYSYSDMEAQPNYMTSLERIGGAFKNIPLKIATEAVEKPLTLVQKSVETHVPISHENVSAQSFMTIALLAFLGGLFLNVMPCVLPVIGLKVLHLVALQKKAGVDQENPEKPFRYGISFTCGVIVAFWVLALILYVVQYFGSLVGWGFQLQEPGFVLFLILVLFSMSLSMFGVYEFGEKVSSKAADLEQSVISSVRKTGDASYEGVSKPSWWTKSHLISFTSGVFVTFIATPCTGPFLGSVLGFLATLHPIQGFLLFSCLGLGVSFPYLLCTSFPSLLKLLPRPGSWMNTFKNVLGFCLVITVVWLSWVLQAQLPEISIAHFLLMLTTLSIALWLVNIARSIFKPFRKRCVQFFSLLFFGITAVSALLIVSPNLFDRVEKTRSEIIWKPFTPNFLQQNDGKIVLVEATAKWCLTCQANKLVFLSSKVHEALLSKNIVTIRADWTKKEPEITAFLRAHGRNGVPVYMLFPKNRDKAPIILPEILTVDTLVDAIEQVSHE